MTTTSLVGAIDNLSLHLASVELQLRGTATAFKLIQKELIRLQD
jgi:hypothetical protein